ncbi:hypothetical protein, variant [Fonticula alba]|nr:hypothetical protein, variant [Fonticula alba]KCV67491.1 hypothetical protein, variant [Fonticula alba]|eukprot:XP_009498052.1 hypothetical protein, variant [Fonticula alba]
MEHNVLLENEKIEQAALIQHLREDLRDTKHELQVLTASRDPGPSTPVRSPGSRRPAPGVTPPAAGTPAAASIRLVASPAGHHPRTPGSIRQPGTAGAGPASPTPGRLAPGLALLISPPAVAERLRESNLIATDGVASGAALDPGPGSPSRPAGLGNGPRAEAGAPAGPEAPAPSLDLMLAPGSPGVIRPDRTHVMARVHALEEQIRACRELFAGMYSSLVPVPFPEMAPGRPAGQQPAPVPTSTPLLEPANAGPEEEMESY